MGKLQRRYRAFISYSQKDKNHARRLHKALESYRLPKGMDATGGDLKNRKLGRFFRDDEEMGAATDLGQALRGAIADSEGLIVICSPHAARSKWVNEEVLHFKRTGRGNNIFAVIVDGEPNVAIDIAPDQPNNECFPPALRFELEEDGELNDRPAEPLGLDIRNEGFSRLKVRLVAGLLNVPFDALWQRDRRRARRRAGIAIGFASIILIGFGLLSRMWWQERERVAEQKFNQDLTLAINDIAERRENQGLARLKPYLSGHLAERVAPVVRDTLSWLQSIGEQLDATTLPRFIRFKGSLIYMSSNRRFHDFSDLGTLVERILVSNDGKRLVVIGNYKTVVLKRASGERLSEVQNGRNSWNSLAFERPDGHMVIFGTHFGSTNGTIFHMALVVSPNGLSVSSSVVAHISEIRRFGITRNCAKIVVDLRDETTELEFKGGGLKQAHTVQRVQTPLHTSGVPASTKDFVPVLGEKRSKLFNGDNENNPFASGAKSPIGRQSLKSAGCRPVELDSELASETSKSLNPISIGKTQHQFVTSRQISPDTITKLYREVSHPKLESSYFGELSARDRFLGKRLWHTLPVPKGIDSSRTDYDSVEGIKLAFQENHANAGMTWKFCHMRDSAPTCEEIAVLHNEARSYEVIRSPDGRHILLAQAGVMLDLKTLNKTSELQEIPTLPGAAFDFDPNITELSIAVKGELIIFRPDRDGKWGRDRDLAAIPLPGPSEIKSDTRYAGLMAIGTGDYVLAHADGSVLRIDREGQVAWRFNTMDIGPIELLRYSEDRTRFAVAGRDGYRVFRTRSGLPISGVLSWPTEGADERAQSPLVDWLHGLNVFNDGSTRFVIWGWEDDKPFTVEWRPEVFQGSLSTRVEHLLCGNDTGSPIEKLQACFNEAR